MTTLDGRDISALARASRERTLGVLRGLHAQRAPGCTTWERYGIPAHGGGRMPVEGCREHDICISSDTQALERFGATAEEA